ncbi:MAG: hypothetical protein ACWA5R_00065 [bacterium]
MKPEINTISNNEASKALKEIEESKLNVLNNTRPPLLIIFFASLSYAAIILGFGMTEHINLRALVMLGGAIGFAIFTGLYVYTYRLLGIKVSLFPRSSASIKMNIILGIVLAGLMVGGREFRLIGFESAPFIASFLCGLIMFFTLKKYPTGEYINSNNSGSNSENNETHHE